jgi:outer membrane biosynthesis protein TonB
LILKGISKESKIGFAGSILFHSLLILFCVFSTLGNKLKQPDYVDLSFTSIETPAITEESYTEADKTVPTVLSSSKLIKMSPPSAAKPAGSTVPTEVRAGVSNQKSGFPRIAPPRYSLSTQPEQIRIPESKLDVPESRGTEYRTDKEPSQQGYAKGNYSQNLNSGKISHDGNYSSASSGISAPGNGSIGKEIKGFSISWRDGGNRSKISGASPKYPENSNKEVQIKVRITVTPDGTISQIVPLQKADFAFENAVTTALKTWTFEKLRTDQPHESQTGIITFNFKLD